MVVQQFSSTIVREMANFGIIFCILLVVFCKEAFSLPVDDSSYRFARNPPEETNSRKGKEEQSGASGAQEFISTAINDGIAASSVVSSPTMIVGGFSLMMQPMPNGSEFAGQMMQMAPHYMSLIPGIGKK